MSDQQENMTGEESLEIIASMIQTAKGTVVNNSFHFLLWGWVCVLANLGNFYLSNWTDFESPHMVWIICIPAAFVSFIYGYFQDKNAKVHTYASTITFWIWMCFVACLVVVLVFMGKLNYNINPLVLLFAGFATFLTGIVLKFTPVKVGGILFWCFAILAFLVSVEYQALVAAVSMITGYLVPGYMLKSRSWNG